MWSWIGVCVRTDTKVEKTRRVTRASCLSPLHSQDIASLHFHFASIHLVPDPPCDHLFLGKKHGQAE